MNDDTKANQPHLGEDEVLLEEYKLLRALMSNSENTLVAWERTFLLTNAFVIGAVGALVGKSDPNASVTTLIVVLLTFAIIACIFWARLVARTYLFGAARDERLMEIEGHLQRLHGPDVFDYRKLEEKKTEEARQNWEKTVPENFHRFSSRLKNKSPLKAAKAITYWLQKESAIKLRKVYPLILMIMNGVLLLVAL